MEQLAKPVEFCPNRACPDYGTLQTDQQQSFDKYGYMRCYVQRYRCGMWRKTFIATSGIIFYRKRTPEHEILEILAPLAGGSQISSLPRALRHQEDAILSWLRQVALHSEDIAEVLSRISASGATSWMHCGLKCRTRIKKATWKRN